MILYPNCGYWQCQGDGAGVPLGEPPLLLVALAEWLRAGWGIAKSPWAPLTLETLEDLYLPWDPTDGLQHDGGSLWVLHLQAVLPQWILGLTVPSSHTQSSHCTHHHPTAGDTLLRRSFISFKRHGRKQRDWQCLWCSQAPHVDIWPEKS